LGEKVFNLAEERRKNCGIAPRRKRTRAGLPVWGEKKLF